MHSGSSVLIPAIPGCRRAAVTNWKDQTSDRSLSSLKLSPEEPAEASLPMDQRVTDLSEGEGISLCQHFHSDPIETPSDSQFLAESDPCLCLHKLQTHRLEQVKFLNTKLSKRTAVKLPDTDRRKEERKPHSLIAKIPNPS